MVKRVAPSLALATASLDADQARKRISRALARQRDGEPELLIRLLQRHRRLPISAAEWRELLTPICPQIPVEYLHPSLLPAQLLAAPDHWQPANSGINNTALLAAHPDLADPDALISSPLFSLILTGQASLYSDIPPVALTAYAAQLRATERNFSRQQGLSALSHLASRGWQLFRSGVSPSKVLDRFLPTPDNHDQHKIPSQSQESLNQLLVVLDADQASAQRQAACGGWSKVIGVMPGQLSQVKESLAELTDEALVSFCHVSDKLDTHACGRIAVAAATQPNAALISSDELLQWAIDDAAPAGNRQCRVAPTPLRLLTRGALGGLVSLRASAMKSVQLPEHVSCLHALLLHLALQLAQREEPLGHYSEALLTRNLRTNPNIPDVATPRDRLAIQESHCKEILQIASRQAGTLLAPGGRMELHPTLRGCLRLAFKPPEDVLISILIPFRDGLELTKACVSSIRRFAGDVPHELILIDNGSEHASTLSWIEEQRELPDVEILRLPIPFNYARLNNLARPHCRGSHLLLLNNDVEFAGPNVLARLLDPFAYSKTAAVGARLLYPDGSIQHQGVILTSGERGCLREPGKYIAEQALLQMLTPLLVQEEFSAASAACLLVRADMFDAIGGFNEEFEITFNDVDLCLRLRRAGGSIVVTPDPKLIHHESVSRGKDLSGIRLARHAREQGLLRHHHADHYANGDPLTSTLLLPSTTQYELRGEAVQPIGRVREQLLYSWRDPLYRPKPSRPLLVFAQFSEDGRLRGDLLPLLQAYRAHADLIFVGATPALLQQPRAMRQLQRLCSIVLIRRNEGYDFGSWMSALRFCADDLPNCRELILTNDSFYGPVLPLEPLFQRLQSCKADVVGLTDNLLYQPHLQSAFMVYRHPVIQSEAFTNFWENLQVWPTKRDLVKQCEVGLPVHLHKSGFTLASLYSQNANGNILHFDWRQLIEEQGFPFIKVSLLRDNPTGQDISDWHQVVRRHNPDLACKIQEHLVYHAAQDQPDNHA
ncbi:rhamnan synthesis F family protein [Vulcanococcus sp. Clear-D1]|uniref:rhamnan synthesis F family protein n=1 Tax=Vulcanococcus sp. Clear-D1 TaxID=2766970 RepID=UPI0019934A48|nr:rhamnan synthesis F family protein [Vulcanococcus sp. Clear-D1]MBD1194993.1 glycosyltransferase [Vulcanococcus sp. Clear-D1]